ncbi:MAG TPA: amylo-alpha-1,6-glucosidase [Pirellulales bacterium]|jgi:predicted glycogen debranching enzyme|nr:amylo-alpha-1,6-glucosidase [Pirellulales bacterium]
MASLLHNRMPWAGQSSELEPLLDREWLVSNGLGGYASGTVSGVSTRRYHGLLISALPAPFGRFVMLNHLSEQLRLEDGTTIRLSGEEQADKLEMRNDYLVDFRLEQGLPIWRYEIDDTVLEKQILLTHLQNTVHVRYSLIAGPDSVRLKLRPAVHFRPHEMPVNTQHAGPYVLHATNGQYELSAGKEVPPLRLFLDGENPAFTIEGKRIPEVLYRAERNRGYESTGALWCPGYFRVDLTADRPATLVASTEPWELIRALTPENTLAAERERRTRLIRTARPEVRDDDAASGFILAADQFIIQPAGRIEDAARARAAGDEVRTVIAGYHWFTDWGRDTMISLEGLTLTTGRQIEAGYILRTFAHYIRDGLIPNLFPEGEREGLYHTADATLWFFHALARYLEISHDRTTLQLLHPKLIDIAEHHLKGTRFGIGVDPSDHLLTQGAPGYQLTWMDAKVGDWVVTPRRGKAVEINALWYNALCLLEKWTRQLQGDAAASRWAEESQAVRNSFNARFWNESLGYLNDIVDAEGGGNDTLCRPNQVFAISLPHPVLDEKHWRPVFDVVKNKLLTPVGLRTLAPGSPDYKPKYYGDLRARDAAYHQGTVWGWLIGPYVDALLKVYPDRRAEARQALEGFVDHLHEGCIGSISEIFDAEEPYTPRGCIAQAWSVAEVLRCWAKTAT